MIRARSYEVLRRAVEEGTAKGWRQAHKHADTPAEEDIREAIESAILDEICEWFEFPQTLALEG